jgi:hypothetical protein
MEGDFHSCGFVARREHGFDAVYNFSGKIDIEHAPRAQIVEVRVGCQVRTVARGLSLVIHLADEFASDEGLEAVVNCSERDRWLALPYAGKYFLSRRVVASLEENFVDQFALWRAAQPAGCEGLSKGLAVVGRLVSG